MSGLDGALRMAVKGMAGGIGLASESVTAYKQRKNNKERIQDNSNRHSSSPLIRGSPDGESHNDSSAHLDRSNGCQRDLEEGELLVNENWMLNEAQQELVAGRPSWQTVGAETGHDVVETTDVFLQSFPPPTYSERAPLPRLQYPVILPQRRPKDRTRGFIRAYAPMLEICGIDQQAWFTFLDTFDKASQASPWLAAINLAAIATIHMPHLLSIAVGLAIQTAVKATMEVQGRYKTNSFLDRINREFFQPRGLYCLVMTWNPDSDEPSEKVNLTSVVTSTVHGSGIRNKFKSSSGKSYGDLALPEAAPLIFPALDLIGSQAGDEAVRTRNKLKNGHEFVAQYWDKRASAKYRGKNPDNLLAQGPSHKFSSRYADPNHPASSGSLISLVTGGHVNPPHSLDRGGGLGSILGGLGNRGGRAGGFSGGRIGSTGGLDRSFVRGRGRGISDSEDAIQNGSRMRGKIVGGSGGATGLGGLRAFGGLAPIKKLLKKNVLYLMVVNMPTDSEMAEAMAGQEQRD